MNPQTNFPYNPKIVAAIGATAAGKDALADYLVAQYGVVAIEVGEFARELAKGEDTHLRYDVSSRDLADYGPEYVMFRLVSEMMDHHHPPVNALVITGVQTPSEAAVLKKQFGSDLLLVFVKVGDCHTRYERTQERNFATDPHDFPTFKQQDDELKEVYDLEETAVYADTILWNNESLESFHQQIDARIVPHLFPQNQIIPPDLMPPL